VTREAIVLKVY